MGKEQIHYYHGRHEMLCGIGVKSNANFPATTSYEEVTCVNCAAHMTVIARAVYKGIENYEEFLELMEAW